MKVLHTPTSKYLTTMICKFPAITLRPLLGGLVLILAMVMAGCVTTASKPNGNLKIVSNTQEMPLPQVGYVTGDSNFSQYQSYFQKVYESIADQWTMLAEHIEREQQDSGSRVVVKFVLTDKGEVNMVMVDFSSASHVATLICKDAIRNRAPFDDWTHEMLEDLGHVQTVRITFIYR